MKVKVEYTTNVDDAYRRAINMHYGKPGLASRDDVKRWCEMYGSSADDDLMHDLQVAIDRGEEPDVFAR